MTLLDTRMLKNIASGDAEIPTKKDSDNLVPRVFWIFLKMAPGSNPAFWKIPRRPWGRGCYYTTTSCDLTQAIGTKKPLSFLKKSSIY